MFDRTLYARLRTLNGSLLGTFDSFYRAMILARLRTLHAFRWRRGTLDSFDPFGTVHALGLRKRGILDTFRRPWQRRRCGVDSGSLTARTVRDWLQ